MGRGRTWRKRKKLSNVQQSGEPLASQVKCLQKWAHSNGVPLHRCGFKPCVFPDTGRGMLAKVQFSKGSRIISVPRNLLITTHYVMKTNIGKLIKRYNIFTLKPIEILSVFLMCEKQKGQSSFWHPYIASLPEVYTTPGYWSNEQILALPLWIRKEALTQIQNIKDSFSKMTVLIAKLSSTYSELMPGLTYTSYLWAWYTVNTRAVYMKQPPAPPYICEKTEDNMVLAPVLDFLNHSADVEVQAGFNKETESYEIHTVTPCKKHQQLFINYGPHDNTKLLLEYGFLVPGNPHNAVVFSLDDFIQLGEERKIPNQEAKICLIEENLIHKNCICSMQCGVSWNLQCGVKIFALESQNIKHWKKVLYETGETDAGSHRSTSKTLLKAILKAKLQSIVIPNFKEPKTFHEEMILSLCEEQKSILEYSIGTVT